MKRLLGLVLLLGLLFLPALGLAADPIAIKVANSDKQTFDSRIKGATISYSLLAKPGNAITVRADLTGTIAGAKVTDGDKIVIQPADYQQSREVKITFDQGIADEQIGTLTLSGSGVVTKTVTIRNTATASAEAIAANQITAKELPGSTLSLDGLLGGAITLFLGAIAVAAFASIIWSGFQYITAGGNAEQTLKARKNIVWALVGVILAISSYLILTLVADLPGLSDQIGESTGETDSSADNGRNTTIEESDHTNSDSSSPVDEIIP